MENNLTELNNALFETLNQLQNKSIKPSEAKAIVDVGNAIINNAKTQLSVIKMVSGSVMLPEVLGFKGAHLKIQNSNKYDDLQDFAISLGYKNVTEAINDLGKNKFSNQFKEQSK